VDGTEWPSGKALSSEGLNKPLANPPVPMGRPSQSFNRNQTCELIRSFWPGEVHDREMLQKLRLVRSIARCEYCSWSGN